MSQVQRRETRAEQTEQISRRLREVALQHIASVGVDGLSMVRVAEDAQVSKSPLYRRYDDSVDLAVDVWDHHLREHLQFLLERIREYVVSDDESSLKWLVSQMHKPSTESAALIECIAAARRFEYLLEAVEIDLERELDEYLASVSHLPMDIALSYVTYVFGGLLIGSLLPTSQSEAMRAFSLWAGYLRDDAFYSDQPMPTEVRPIPLNVPHSDDQTLGNLVTAATKVIMRTGFEKATANRISRYANKAFSTSYAYFDSKEELMMYATEFVFRDSIVRNDIMLAQGDEQQHTELAASRLREVSTASASEEARIFRVEATLAARHYAELQDAVKNLFRQSLDQILSISNPRKEIQEEVRSVWVGVRIAGFGHNVLGLVARRHSDINWMSTARAAALLVREHAMKNYVDDDFAKMVS